MKKTILGLVQNGFIYLPYTHLKPIIQQKIAWARKCFIADDSLLGMLCAVPESLLASCVLPFASFVLWHRSYFGQEPITSAHKLKALSLLPYSILLITILLLLMLTIKHCLIFLKKIILIQRLC